MEPLHEIGHVAVVDHPAQTDRSLWALAVAGDELAFGTVYDRYAPRLLAYAYRRTSSRQRAEDVVSIVMLEAWRRRREVRFGPDEALAGWLFLTCRYVLANQARSSRRHRAALERIAQMARPPAEDLDRHLVEDERLRRAMATLAELSARDRHVLELAAFSGLSEAEMAIALGIPVGTLKSRLSRARRRLADKCEPPGHAVATIRFATHQEDLP